MISIIGMPFNKNFGDPILLENTMNLVKKILPNENINIIDMELTEAPKLSKSFYKISKKILSLSYKNKSTNYWKKMIYIQRLILKNYYLGKVKDSKAIIFAGGAMIKYLNEELGIRVALICEVAQECGIPVMLNAVGVEGYDNTHPTVSYLKEMLNMDVVKVITTRDDIETLNNCYVNSNSSIVTAWVPDSAWWSDVTYNINSRNHKENTVGIGLIRKKIFQDNNLSFYDEQFFDFWAKVCNQLISKNLKFEFFTNGVISDNLFVAEFIKRNPQFSNIEVRIPNSPSELVDIISNYDRIFCSRMHSSIIAYSVGVPSLSIQWNNKLKLFYNQINHSDRIINIKQMENLSSKKIIDKLLSITYSNEDQTFKEEKRELTKDYLEYFLKNYILE